ncbi:MAG: succinate dehydrogenase assembly factor 2 [Pseudomonadota bacterium]
MPSSTDRALNDQADQANLDARVKRILWRASHRGMKELDIMLGRYADAKAAAMDEASLQAFEEFLAMPDPDLHQWLMMEDEGAPPPGFSVLVADIRTFHGL